MLYKTVTALALGCLSLTDAIPIPPDSSSSAARSPIAAANAQLSDSVVSAVAAMVLAPVNSLNAALGMQSAVKASSATDSGSYAVAATPDQADAAPASSVQGAKWQDYMFQGIHTGV